MNQAVSRIHGPLTSSATSINWTPDITGTYLVVIGITGAVFGTGAVTVTQDGLAYEDLNAVTTATRKLTVFAAGAPVTFSVATPDGTTDVEIRTTLLPEWPRRY